MTLSGPGSARIALVCALSLLAGQPGRLAAQPQGGAAPAPAAATFKPEELDQLVAPIALYPDPLLAQVLMASTYPLEIVQADRWVKQNPKVTGKVLEDAMQKQPWDPSVKSLTALPQVLAMMSDKLDWTQKLGDAFLADQAQVMQAVQKLRAKANAEGNLKSGKEQTVTTAQEGSQTVIKIEPADPQVVYVPTYNPTVVYGPWPYPAYPPYYYYPPGYVPGAAFFTFAVGVAVGSALWGGCNWGGNNVYINHNTYNNFNRTNIGSGNSNWQHRPEHRKGVAYRDQATAQRYDRAGAGARDAQSRDAFRGRDAGPSAGTRDVGAGNLNSGGNRGGFDGIDRGAQTRDVSQRGNQSLNSSGLNRGSTGARPSAGARPSGGARAGGGRGGRR